MIDKQLLLESCEAFGITLPEGAADKFDTYAQLLVEWNQKMNLTAITEPEEIVLKHFVDSLLLLKWPRRRRVWPPQREGISSPKTVRAPHLRRVLQAELPTPRAL